MIARLGLRRVSAARPVGAKTRRRLGICSISRRNGVLTPTTNRHHVEEHSVQALEIESCLHRFGLFAELGQAADVETDGELNLRRITRRSQVQILPLLLERSLPDRVSSVLVTLGFEG